jgi:hypothetical protein
MATGFAAVGKGRCQPLSDTEQTSDLMVDYFDGSRQTGPQHWESVALAVEG